MNDESTTWFTTTWTRQNWNGPALHRLALILWKIKIHTGSLRRKQRAISKLNHAPFSCGHDRANSRALPSRERNATSGDSSILTWMLCSLRRPLPRTGGFNEATAKRKWKCSFRPKDQDMELFLLGSGQAAQQKDWHRGRVPNEGE